MISLRLLGTPTVEGPDGEPLRSVVAAPKQLALLAYLAAAEPDSFVRRCRRIRASGVYSGR